MAKKTKKRPSPRVAILREEQLNPTQRALMDAMRSGPRGKSLPIRGPFAAFLHAPAFGDLAQRLGAHCRYKTTVLPRLSEFAILCTARLWRAQFEWYAHEPMALKAGVSAKTVRDALMCELDGRYPGFSLSGHKGYPTRAHVAALQALGPSPLHRRSFAPVRVDEFIED